MAMNGTHGVYWRTVVVLCFRDIPEITCVRTQSTDIDEFLVLTRREHTMPYTDSVPDDSQRSRCILRAQASRVISCQPTTDRTPEHILWCTASSGNSEMLPFITHKEFHRVRYFDHESMFS